MKILNKLWNYMKSLDEHHPQSISYTVVEPNERIAELRKRILEYEDEIERIQKKESIIK